MSAASSSGGQRQRVAISPRHPNRRADLVLDEVTSALDSESEALVQEALENPDARPHPPLWWHIACHTVAASTALRCWPMAEIVEDGTHAQLVEAGGEYASLWSRQTGAFLEV